MGTRRKTAKRKTTAKKQPANQNSTPEWVVLVKRGGKVALFTDETFPDLRAAKRAVRRELAKEGREAGSLQLIGFAKNTDGWFMEIKETVTSLAPVGEDA